MASSALEEKINKIRLQNEEIKRRYEEVEADKKNAAKLNALVQLVPSDDWPERKEPPEFSAPIKNTPKPKVFNKEHNDRPQRYSGIQERPGKKEHKFNQRDGPPPDPKYNFLADSEREMCIADDDKLDDDKNRSRNKSARGTSRRRGGGEGRGGGGGGSRDAYFKDNRGPHAFHSKEESFPEYEAWRAERTRIDEARINRQKTAEGNWRREWDSNKVNIEKDISKKGDSLRKDSNNYERRSNHYDNDYSNRGHGGSRTYHGSQKNHGHQDFRRPHHDQSREYKRPMDKPPLSPIDDRTITTTDKSIKVTVNHGNQAKGPVMSVKVNSPSIAGTGRVGPRQKSRVTYSSQSDADVTTHEINNFSRQKSFDEKTAGANFNGGQKVAPKSPFSQRKKDGNSKSPYPQRKEFRNDESSARYKNSAKAPQRNESREKKQPNCSTPKLQRAQKQIPKAEADQAENFEDALPSEYNPVKPLTEEFTKQKIINDKYDEDALNNTNETNEGYSDMSKNLDDSAVTIESTDQSICDKNIESTNDESTENNEQNDIFKNKNDSTKDVSQSIENDIISNEIVEKSEDAENNEIVEKSGDNENNEKLLSTPEEKIIEETLHKKTLCTITQEEIVGNISSEEIQIASSEKIEENESIKNQEAQDIKITEITEKNYLCIDNTENKNMKKEILNEKVEDIVLEKNNQTEKIEDQNEDVSKESNNDESHQTNVELKFYNEPEKVIDSSINKLIESEEIQATDTGTSQNKSVNDSGFVDNNITMESIDLDEVKAYEINDPYSKHIKGSSVVDTSNNSVSNSDTPIITTDENNSEKKSKESEKCDSIITTKEACEKTEICDIHSAAPSEISQIIEDHTTKSENKEEVSKKLENPTKDSEVNIVNDSNESSESSKNIDEQKAIPNELKAEENPVKAESTKVVSEESKKD